MLKLTMTHCRSNAYLMIGICLGLSLSLIFGPANLNDFDDGSAIAETNWYSTLTPSADGAIDDYEPEINLAGKPRTAQKTPKAFVRPRYYSTELGIREKLFVGVITSREYLHSRGVAINKTVGHLVDRIRYFISVPEGTKPNVSLPGIVGITDTRAILKPFHVIKYITDFYPEVYDFYYIVKDASYVNARRLNELVGKISVGWDVHIGTNIDDGDYCSLDAGILLSNSAVRKLKTSLDWCVKNTFSSSDDVNFGRCVVHASQIPCVDRIQGQLFSSLELPNVFQFNDDFGRLTKNENLADAISIYPIFDHRTIYKINAYIAATSLKRVEREIRSLRGEISESAGLGPEDRRNVSWPVGNQPGNRAPGRFDLLPWTYMNETHVFMETHNEISRKSVGSEKMDFKMIVESAISFIDKEYRGELVYERLINGYRKFDASRGMDYILDLQFRDNSNGKKIVKRIEVCKPLGKVEILPVPYVTENSRINMVLVVDGSTKNESLEFLERYAATCMEKKDKTFLILVLLYEPDAATKGNSDVFNDVKQRALGLTDLHKKDQSKVTWLSVRLPIVVAKIRMDPLLRVAIADLVTKKFTPESLLLFVETRMELSPEYLNRVRMNTISQWQFYSPIPFVEYDPNVAIRKSENSEQSSTNFDVVRNAGTYDDLSYESIAFYVKDYSMMRRESSFKIPQVRGDKDIATVLALDDVNVVDSLFQLFVEHSELHAFRAIEPALKIRNGELPCDGTRSERARNICEKRRNMRLGHRGQLAKLILDYQNQG